MSDNVQSLLREAADALWLIPQHAGLAQRVQNAAEMTRQSEAEVTEMLDEMCGIQASYEMAVGGYAKVLDAEMSDVRRRILAALSTPPLPSAEPVAWGVVRDGGAVEDGRMWRHRDKAERFVANMGSYAMQQPRLGYEIVPLYTTPPAAAQDTVTSWVLDQLTALGPQPDVTQSDAARYAWAGKATAYDAVLCYLSGPDPLDAARAAGGE